MESFLYNTNVHTIVQRCKQHGSSSSSLLKLVGQVLSKSILATASHSWSVNCAVSKKGARQCNCKCSKCPESHSRSHEFCAANLKKAVAGPAPVVVQPLVLSASQQQHIRATLTDNMYVKFGNRCFQTRFKNHVGHPRAGVYLGQKVRLALWTHGVSCPYVNRTASDCQHCSSVEMGYR